MAEQTTQRRRSAPWRVVRTINVVLVLCLMLSVLPYSRKRLQLIARAEAAAVGEPTPLYLPSVEHVRLITLGYNGMFSDLLWFNTLNYFGKQYKENRDFRWLGHMCDLVTSLDPHAQHAYEFCSALLSWLAHEPEMSHRLLSRAIETQPRHWRYWYHRGFTSWYFLERTDEARDDFKMAASLPGAPPFVASLAGRLMVREESPETAIVFLQDLIKNTTDPMVIKALKKKLRKAFISRDIRVLETVLQKYEVKYGMPAEKWEDLIEARLLSGAPKDPGGKVYKFDPQTNKVSTHNGRKGLEFYGKTAKTGLAQTGR